MDRLPCYGAAGIVHLGRAKGLVLSNSMPIVRLLTERCAQDVHMSQRVTGRNDINSSEIMRGMSQPGRHT
jgi:hypothetical protein